MAASGSRITAALLLVGPPYPSPHSASKDARKRADGGRSFRSRARLRPTRDGGLIGLLGGDPAARAGLLDLLPERRARLEIVHQEFRRRESVVPMRGGGYYQHDVLAGRDAAEAMDDAHAKERPAALRSLDLARDLGLRHGGIVLEGERRDGGAVLLAAADASEGDDGADVGAPARERGHFGGGIEALLLQRDAGGTHLQVSR